MNEQLKAFREMMTQFINANFVNGPDMDDVSNEELQCLYDMYKDGTPLKKLVCCNPITGEQIEGFDD